MKLTKAQTKALKAAFTGGVRGFGQSELTINILIKRGLLTSSRDHFGYHNITAAGRTALQEKGERG